ncbi:MAG: phosphoribosylanthranilate isomerase [Acidobacteriota bacterium]|nr:phosphoribosylanthranilate isomerase [Acidobacteriota bacterium]
MFAKICGITNAGDALAAIEHGAGALGFNFCPASPRYIAPNELQHWIGTLPAAAWKVGVFVNESPARVTEISEMLHLDVIQLHGDEPPEDFPEHLRVWKAVQVHADFTFATLDRYPAEAVLLDGPYGGSGQNFDWSLASGHSRKVIVAGGLDAANVRLAIERMRPWGVDACSRIESSPGKKDRVRMAQFLKAALS